jgi:hypothetical protein
MTCRQYVLDVLHAPAPPRPILSRRGRACVVGSPADDASAELFLKLAGVRIEPRTRRKHDTAGGYGVAPCAQTLSVVDIVMSDADRAAAGAAPTASHGPPMA